MIAADALGRLVSHLRRRADEELEEIKRAAGADIVVTHDGTTLFASGRERADLRMRALSHRLTTILEANAPEALAPGDTPPESDGLHEIARAALEAEHRDR